MDFTLSAIHIIIIIVKCCNIESLKSNQCLQMGVYEIKKQEPASSGGKQLLKSLVFCLHKGPVSGMVWFRLAIFPFPPNITNITVEVVCLFWMLTIVDVLKIHNFLSETDYNPGVSMTTHEMRQLHCSEKLAAFSPEEQATSLNNVICKSRICSRGNVCNL